MEDELQEPRQKKTATFFSIGTRGGPDGQNKKSGEVGVDGSFRLGEHSDRPLFFILGIFWLGVGLIGAIIVVSALFKYCRVRGSC